VRELAPAFYPGGFAGISATVKKAVASYRTLKKALVRRRAKRVQTRLRPEMYTDHERIECLALNEEIVWGESRWNAAFAKNSAKSIKKNGQAGNHFFGSARWHQDGNSPRFREMQDGFVDTNESEDFALSPISKKKMHVPHSGLGTQPPRGLI